MKIIALRSKRRFAQRWLIGHALWVGVMLGAAGATALAAPAARADEFATIAAGDPLYGHLATVTKAGWLSSAATGTPLAGGHPLTRYEVALETAKAIFTVTARQQADAGWVTRAPQPALRALLQLTNALRPELKKLDVDVNAATALLNTLLQNAPDKALPAPAPPRAVAAPGRGLFPGATAAPASSPPRAPAPTVAARNRTASGRSGGTPALVLPLSQRLRVSAALQSLQREADDPFGDQSLASLAQRNLTNGRDTTSNLSVRAGAAVAVTPWLRLHADYEKRQLAARRALLERSLDENHFAGAREINSVGGGADIALGSALTVSGNVARVGAPGSDLSPATRIGGGVGLSAWQNRLSLSANLSRLVPEDSLAISSTAASFGLDFDVTERLSLRLLYQKMFSAQNQPTADRVMAGGVSITF